MSGVDVSELAKEDLPKAEFPVGEAADFRLYMSSAVRSGIEQHAKADTSVEICGVLVGTWARDEQGPFAEVSDYIRCDNAASKFAEVTFTHESWAQINAEMDAKYEDKRIVGWYHSHPDFGIFLSDRDCFIHENFFSGAGQVALVVDPVRDLEGVFAWENGKPTPMAHYWVGDEIRTVVASQRNPKAEQSRQDRADEVISAATAMPPADSLLASPSFLMLAGLALLLLGYSYGGWKSNWERQKIIEGTIAHYAQAKFMRYGLQDNLQQVQNLLRDVEQNQAKLPESTEGLSEEKLAEYRKQRKELGLKLQLSSQALQSIANLFGLSPSEQRVIENLERQALAGQITGPRANKTKPQTPESQTSRSQAREFQAPKSKPSDNKLPITPKQPVKPGPAPLETPQPAEKEPADVLEPANAKVVNEKEPTEQQQERAAAEENPPAEDNQAAGKLPAVEPAAEK